MPASAYLQSGDLANYGVPTATAAQIAQASVLIDAYLRRPSGLLYTADSNGNPCFMSALDPEFTLTASASFGPGNGIQVPVAGPLAALQIGDCVVLDRATPSLTEVVQVTSIDITNGKVTLGSTAANVPNGVQFAHNSGCNLETGLVVTERKYLPKNRSEVTLGYTPVMRVIGGTGRYGYGRRGEAGATNTDNFNLLASLNKFGGPPAWEIWPANSAAGIEPYTGQLWVPAGIMLAYYSEIRVRYVAGYLYSNLPSDVKLACAQIIVALQQNPQIGNVKNLKSGDTAIEQFSASVLSDDVKAMLQPFRARAFA